MRSMLDFDGVYLGRTPVHMRMGIDGLAAIVADSMTLDPFSRCLFVFTNRTRDKVKALYWDRTGFALWYKRLERDVFRWPESDVETITISPQQLGWLLDGYDILKMRPHETLKFQMVS